MTFFLDLQHYGVKTCKCEVKNFSREGVKKFDIKSANIIWKPNLTVKIEKKEDLDKLIRLNEELEDNDDVQNCFSNLDFDSELLEVNNA